jgi:hypothetical protein
MPSDAAAWPDDSEGDPQKAPEALYEAKLEVRKKRTDQEIERATAEVQSALAIEQAYYTSVFSSATGSIDRARASADTVQKAATAIVTIYTGILAVAFSVTDHPLPFRGVYAAVLLGIAIVCSTTFLAYLPDTPTAGVQENGTTSGSSGPAAYAVELVKWTRRTALRRTYWLRASVIALAAALVFLPAPFITWSDKSASGTLPEWPAPSSKAGDNPSLQKILYAAQVNEVAKARGGPTSAEKPWLKWAWLGAFVGSLIMVFGLAKITGSRRKVDLAAATAEAVIVLIALGMASGAGILGFVVGRDSKDAKTQTVSTSTISGRALGAHARVGALTIGATGRH